MRAHCAPEVQIKAAGGIRTLDDLLRVKALGVTRVGTTCPENILLQHKDRDYIELYITSLESKMNIKGQYQKSFVLVVVVLIYLLHFSTLYAQKASAEFISTII